MESAKDRVEDLEREVNLALCCENGRSVACCCVGADEDEEVWEAGGAGAVVGFRRVGEAVVPLLFRLVLEVVRVAEK